jgi:hypothetical protein
VCVVSKLNHGDVYQVYFSSLLFLYFISIYCPEKAAG